MMRVEEFRFHLTVQATEYFKVWWYFDICSEMWCKPSNKQVPKDKNRCLWYATVNDEEIFRAGQWLASFAWRVCCFHTNCEPYQSWHDFTPNKHAILWRQTDLALSHKNSQWIFHSRIYFCIINHIGINTWVNPKYHLRYLTLERGKKKKQEKNSLQGGCKLRSSSKCAPGVKSISSLFKSWAGLLRIAGE